MIHMKCYVYSVCTSTNCPTQPAWDAAPLRECMTFTNVHRPKLPVTCYVNSTLLLK